jgi:hypothetical protein
MCGLGRTAFEKGRRLSPKTRLAQHENAAGLNCVPADRAAAQNMADRMACEVEVHDLGTTNLCGADGRDVCREDSDEGSVDEQVDF